jgi:hypothetical protein
VVLQRAFERLCAAAGDKSSPLFDTNSDFYNKVTGHMRYTDVTQVIADMKQSKNLGKVSVDDYHILEAGSNMIFHRTMRNVVLAIVFCAGAACRLLQFCGPKALVPALENVVDELLALLGHLHLHDEASVLQSIAASQCHVAPLDLNNLVWLKHLLWNTSPPQFEASMLRFEAGPKCLLLKFCQEELKHIKKKMHSLALPHADTPDHKFRRCDMLLAALALSSLKLHPAVDSCTCVTTRVASGLLIACGKRAPEQRDDFFVGRLPELQQVCDAVEAVLRNVPPASDLHVAVLGLPGMGKSLLVSQALLKMQAKLADEQREVYFLKLRGGGATSFEEDLIAHARSLGSKIAVAPDSASSVALTNLKQYLSCLRFVAIIDDANSDGLQAAAKWIPKSSALHLILVTSQQERGELSAIESAHGSFRKISLPEFDSFTSLKLLQKICNRCVSICDQTERLESIAQRFGSSASRSASVRGMEQGAISARGNSHEKCNEGIYESGSRRSIAAWFAFRLRFGQPEVPLRIPCYHRRLQ